MRHFNGIILKASHSYRALLKYGRMSVAPKVTIKNKLARTAI